MIVSVFHADVKHACDSIAIFGRERTGKEIGISEHPVGKDCYAACGLAFQRKVVGVGHYHIIYFIQNTKGRVTPHHQFILRII